jgi:uncharacterized protein YqgC (DUF456 family)
MIYVGLLLLILALIAGWCMTMLSMPGNWVIVAAAALDAWLMPSDTRFDIGWQVVAVLVGLAIVAELLEVAASALGAKRAGGSRRSAVLAIGLSIVGAFAGVSFGSVIPLIGNLVGAIVGAGLGALIGAMLGETWKGRTLAESWKVGHSAFWGRILGALAKIGIGTAMTVIALIAALF